MLRPLSCRKPVCLCPAHCSWCCTVHCRACAHAVHAALAVYPSIISQTAIEAHPGVSVLPSLQDLIAQAPVNSASDQLSRYTSPHMIRILRSTPDWPEAFPVLPHHLTLCTASKCDLPQHPYFTRCTFLARQPSLRVSSLYRHRHPPTSKAARFWTRCHAAPTFVTRQQSLRVLTSPRHRQLTPHARTIHFTSKPN